MKPRAKKSDGHSTVDEVAKFLERFAPPHLAEAWDNVGLLMGRRHRPVAKVMTCLTITPDSGAEAIEKQADLIVSHHPLPFRAFKRLTDDDPEGRLLLDLLRADIAIYSPHTAFDSAAEGINQQLAEGLGLLDIRPLAPATDAPANSGTGRIGRLPQPMILGDFAEQPKKFLRLRAVQAVGTRHQLVERLAIGCGSAGELLDLAASEGCDTFVTGELRFHGCLDAQARKIGLVLVGHYASERFAVENLARVLSAEFPQLDVWASGRERDPLWSA